MLPPYLEPAGGRAGRTTRGREVGAKVEPCQFWSAYRLFHLSPSQFFSCSRTRS